MYVQIIHTQKYPYLKTIFILCIHRHTPIPTHRHNYTQKTPDIHVYTHTQTHMYTHRYNIVYITHQKYSIYMYIVYIIHVHVSLDT